MFPCNPRPPSVLYRVKKYHSLLHVPPMILCVSEPDANMIQGATTLFHWAREPCLKFQI